MLLLIFLSVFHLGLTGLVQPYYDLENVEIIYKNFEQYKIKYNRSYSHDEETLRFRNFVQNLAIINEMNEKNPLAVFDINHMTDWSEVELRRLSCLSTDRKSLRDSVCTSGVLSNTIMNGSMPDSLDYRDKNAVTPVQDQKTCLSCWAFAATGVVEGAYALKHNNLLKLSEQELVDCDTTSTCTTGGHCELGFSYMIQNGGQMSEDDYPYMDVKQQCAFVPSKAQVKVSACKSYQNIPEDKIANILAEVGPLAIYIDMDTTKYNGYSGGIFDHCAQNGKANHAVLLIGYGTENGVPFWIIKNSWAQKWGEQGFGRFKRGVGCLAIGEGVSYGVVD